MSTAVKEALVVAVSSRALFDTREEEALIKNGELTEFLTRRVELAQNPLEKGTAFSFISGLLALNRLGGDAKPVEVVIVSKNNPAACLRVTNSIAHHKLDISCYAFTSGEPIVDYLKEFGVALFLSCDEHDVAAALRAGVGAARVYPPPSNLSCPGNQLRIAFDGDAVLFSDEAEKVYQDAKKADPGKAVAVFHEHEKRKAAVPLPPGPLAAFFRLLAQLQRRSDLIAAGQIPAIRTALITARNAPAHERALRTLQSWGVEVNTAIFLGSKDKTGFVRAFNPQIFFDDQHRHLSNTSEFVPSALVPCETTAHLNVVSSLQPPVVATPPLAPSTPIEVNSSIGGGSAPEPFLSKDDFERRCRSVFSSYVPMSDGSRKLPKSQRDFITQGLTRSGSERARLAAEIERYSLVSLHTHDPMLNREGGALGSKIASILEDSLSKEPEPDLGLE